MKTKTTVEINPVGWRGNKILKFQAVATLTKDGNALCRIYGEPMDSEDDAMKSLSVTCENYSTLVHETRLECLKFKL